MGDYVVCEKQKQLNLSGPPQSWLTVPPCPQQKIGGLLFREDKTKVLLWNQE